MHLGHLELFVADPIRSADFYVTHFGFEKVVQQGPDYIWLKSGEAEVLLRRRSVKHDAPYGDCGPAMVLYTNDLPASMARLEASGLSPAACDNGDECCPLYRDPDGNWIQLVDPNHP